MTENEFEQYKEFIRKLKYEVMTLDDYELIFNRLGGQGVIKSQSDDQWILYTMCHNLNPFDGSPKLYFYTETRSLYCYTRCNKSYDLYELVRKRFELQGKKKNLYACVKWVCEQLNIPFKFTDEVQKSNTSLYNWKGLLKYTKKGRQEKPLKIYDKSILNNFETIYHQDWIDDNISIETMEKYGIKYYPYNDSIIIPCLDRYGELIGIRQRFLDPYGAKYLPLELLDGTSYEFPVNKTLYGLNYNADNIEHYKRVVLFEAEKSVLQTDTMFACKNFAVALYGKAMSKEKVKQILELGIEEVIIGIDFDYDEVGDNELFNKFKDNVYRIGDYFKPYCKVTAMISYKGHDRKDSPSDKGMERYLELFNNREELY